MIINWNVQGIRDKVEIFKVEYNAGLSIHFMQQQQQKKTFANNVL